MNSLRRRSLEFDVPPGDDRPDINGELLAIERPVAPTPSLCPGPCPGPRYGAVVPHLPSENLIQVSCCCHHIETATYRRLV